MKILFLADFIPPRHIGGPGKRCFETAQRLRLLGHEVFFITSCQEKSTEGFEEREGIRIFNIFSKYPVYLRDYLGIYNPLVIAEIKKIIANIKPDVIHADTIHTHLSYASLKIARKYAKAVFLYSRDFMLFKYGKFLQKERECGKIKYKVSWFENLKSAGKRFNPFRNFLIRHYLKNVDKIFAVSEELAKALKQNGYYSVEVIHNGLSVPEIELPYIVSVSKTILLAGRINEAKGIYALLDALPLIKQKEPKAKIILMGAQEQEKKRIQVYILKQKLNSGDIKVLGWVTGEAVQDYFKSATLVVSPSLYPDPFPGVNLEAALYKKPAVTTCFGGAKEFVLDGVSGYVIDPFNKKELAERILDLLLDEQKCRQFGEAAYRRLKNNFSLDAQTQKLFSWYKKYYEV